VGVLRLTKNICKEKTRLAKNLTVDAISESKYVFKIKKLIKFTDTKQNWWY
jgi:hypothetical protein